MKKSVLFLSIFLWLPLASMAQESNLNSNMGFGIHLSQYQRDFGLGVQYTTPYFLYESLAFRAKANLMWHEHIENLEYTWSQYSNYTLGLVGTAGKINDFMRLYGEGGVIFILPNSSFSTADYDLGGYGLFGFEFYFFPNGNYFIELGAVGTGAQADEIPGNPIYSNGFMTNVGFRYQF